MISIRVPPRSGRGVFFCQIPRPKAIQNNVRRTKTRPNFPGLAFRIFKRIVRKEKATLQGGSQRRFSIFILRAFGMLRTKYQGPDSRLSRSRHRLHRSPSSHKPPEGIPCLRTHSSRTGCEARIQSPSPAPFSSRVPHPPGQTVCCSSCASFLCPTHWSR